MATLANIFNRFMEAGAEARSEQQTRVVRVAAESYLLRPLPNDDVYFFVKRIDNSRVVRKADPKARKQSWKARGASCLAAAGLIATLLPSAYGLMANYQLHQLRQEHERLMGEQSRLELQEATLVSPERLQRLAKDEGFTDPTPDHTIYLTPKNDSSLALNRQ
jgi:hypothetical protein